MNTSGFPGEIKNLCLKKINVTNTYLNQHKYIKSKLFETQCRAYGKDRSVPVENPFHAGWHSNLSMIERYIIMKPFLVGVLPKGNLILPEDWWKRHGCMHRCIPRGSACCSCVRKIDLSQHLLCREFSKNFVKQWTLWLPVRPHENGVFPFWHQREKALQMTIKPVMKVENDSLMMKMPEFWQSYSGQNRRKARPSLPACSNGRC